MFCTSSTLQSQRTLEKILFFGGGGCPNAKLTSQLKSPNMKKTWAKFWNSFSSWRKSPSKLGENDNFLGNLETPPCSECPMSFKWSPTSGCCGERMKAKTKKKEDFLVVGQKRWTWKIVKLGSNIIFIYADKKNYYINYEFRIPFINIPLLKDNTTVKRPNMVGMLPLYSNDRSPNLGMPHLRDNFAYERRLLFVLWPQ